MLTRSFLCEKICLTLVTIQKIQGFLMRVIGKMKDEFGGIFVVEFVGLKSKMHSMKKTDDNECFTAKMFFFNEKIIRHKMKRI